MTIGALSISGYRSIKKLHLDLKPLTLIVGPNGSGKTNLYRSLYLLSAAARGQLASALAEEGGMPSALWAGSRTRGPVRMTIGVTLDQLAYELSCGLPTPGNTMFVLDPEVKEEHVWLLEARRRTPIVERTRQSAMLRDAEGNRRTYPIVLQDSESILSQLTEPQLFPVLWALRQELAGWRFYHHFRSDPEAPARHINTGVRTTSLSHDGHDLAAALETIIEIGDQEELRRSIASAFPGATLHIEGSHGRFGIQLGMPGLHRPLSGSELSDGTLRYLYLLAALLSPRPPAFIAMNEPETSIHADLLAPLATLLLRASRRSQLLVTTHSAELIRHLESDPGTECVRLQKTQGETRLSDERRRAADEEEE